MSPATYTVTAPAHPALTPPPGVIPDFQGPYTLKPYTDLTIAGGIIITTCLVGARMFVKARVVRKFLWEDWTCFVGWLTYLAYVSLEWRTAFRGAGTHQWNLPFEDLQYNFWLSNYSDMCYCIAIMLVKLSILLLINRIFLSVNRSFLFWMTQLLIWVNSLFYSIAVFLAIFACRPRKNIWNPDLPGKCLNSKSLYITSASFNTVSDIAMLSVPLYLIWSLQTSFRRKLGISAVFGTGTFACCCSLVRIYYEIKITRTKDFSFVHMETGLLGYAEIACGLICGCLPILPLFWQHISKGSSGGISLQPVNNRAPGQHSNYTPSKVTRTWDEAYDSRHKPPGRDWVKLEDGTVTKVPDSHLEQKTVDELAVTDAILGNVEEGVVSKAKQAVRHQS